MRPPPSIQQLIDSVPRVDVEVAIDWLTRHQRDQIAQRRDGRWQVCPSGGECFVAGADALVDRYRLLAARVAQGAGG